MNDQLQQQLADYLKAISDTAKTGAAFVADQAPVVVREKIAYGRAEETAMLIIASVLAYVCVRLVLWGARNMNTRDFDKEGQAIAAMILGGIGGVFMVVLVFVGLDATLKVWFAPRLYVLEWAMSLLKK